MDFKKVIAFTTALLMCSVGIATPQFLENVQTPIVANADTVVDGACGDNCYYRFRLSTNSLTIYGSGDMYDYKNYEDTPWYTYKDSIKNISIGNQVTSIGDYAFGGLSSVTSVTIHDDVTSIGKYAFFECTSLTSIDIPDGVTSIGELAFYDCTSLTSIAIPKGVTYIDKGILAECKALKSVDIPDSVTSIGEGAFSECDALTSITIPDSVTSLEKGAFTGCINLKNIKLSSNLKSIGDVAFWYCSSLEEINLPNGLTSIGEFAFCLCDSLKVVKIPDTVTSMDTNVFDSCENIVQVILPSGLTTIEDSTFNDCISLEEVFIPKSIKTIGSDAFNGCTALERVYYEGNTSEFKQVTISDNNEPLQNAKLYTNAKIVNNEETTTTTTTTTAPVTTTTAPKTTTTKTSTTTTAPKTTTTKTPTTTTAPKTTTTTTTTTTVKDTPTVQPTSGKCGKNCTWKYDSASHTLTISGTGAMYDYEDPSQEGSAQRPWANYTNDINKIVVESGVTHVGNYAFYLCMYTSKTTLADTVTSIGDYVFYNCRTMSSVDISANCTEIGEGAFYACTALKDVTLPNKLTTIGDTAFIACYGIESITIPKNVTSIGKGCFAYCNILSEITIPTSVNSIGANAFYEDNALTDIYYKGTQSDWSHIAINISNKSVLDNVTIHYLGDELVDKTIVFGQDNWKFANTRSYFGAGNYYISQEFLTNLKSKLSNTDKEKVIKHVNDNWRGSCYGLATLSVLAKEGVFDVSEFQDGAKCLYDVSSPHDDDVESLINYYFLTQYTSALQNEYTTFINSDNKETMTSLIEMCSAVKEGGTPVVLGFQGTFNGIPGGGHAVTAYGVEYGSWTWDDVEYGGRILIYDNNIVDSNDEYCLYFDTKTYDWIIPHYGVTSKYDGKILLACNDLNHINAINYFDNSTSVSTATTTDNYIAMLSSTALNCDFNVTSIKKSSNSDGWVTNSTADDNIQIIYDFMDDVTQSSPSFRVPLYDSTSGWQFDLKGNTDTLDLSMSYENSLLSASAEVGTSAKFSPEGYVEINAVDSDFELSAVYNEGYYHLPWYKVSVDGHDSNVASLTNTTDGMVLYGDNLVDVTVSASNDDYVVGLNFSTDADTVLIYAIDDYTIGIAIDQDGDGTFETDSPIATSSPSCDLNYDGVLNSEDIFILKKSIFGMSKAVCDLNDDGVTNILDLVQLKNIILNS